MSRLRNVHWLAPTTMVLALLGGFMLALGHHLFYKSLDHKSAPVGSYTFAGRELPKQQFNIFVGTALAFLIRISLAVAVSTAYIQIFWRSMKNMKQSPTLAELDSAKASLDNVLSLFNIKLVFKYPLLALLAVIFWCTPIATIFPPATLSIENVARLSTLMLRVPQFDFTTLKFSAEFESITTAPSETNWKWTGPSQSVQNIALAVSGLGQILPIAPPAPNASWILDFWGPALRCSDVAVAEQDGIYTNIWNSYKSINNSAPSGPYALLSWVPWSYIDTNTYYFDWTASSDVIPFQFDIGGNLIGPLPSLVSTTGPASLFITVLPESLNFTIAGGEKMVYNGQDCDLQTVQNLTNPLSGCIISNITFTPALVYENSTLLRCDLVNTSYTVEFSYSSGSPDIRILPNITDNLPTVHASTHFIGPSTPSDSITHNSEPANCSTFQTVFYSDDIGTPCIFNTNAVRAQSYQAIMAAFNQLVLGSIQNQAPGSYDWANRNSMVMRTILAQTEELAFLRDWFPNPHNGTYLQNIISSTAGWAYPGLVSAEPTNTRGDLKSVLEQLFQNLTISLLVDPYLQPNYSSLFAPPEFVNVSLETYQNTYNYDRKTLWVTYGISILFTTLAVIAGLITLSLSGASYSNNISTIIRISRTAELSAEVKDQDRSGHDPLPTYLKYARLDMGANTATAKACEMTDTPPEEQSLVPVS